MVNHTSDLQKYGLPFCEVFIPFPRKTSCNMVAFLGTLTIGSS